MHFRFSDEQLMFRDTVADLLANECEPEAVRAAGQSPSGRVPGLWGALAEMGVLGVAAPEAHGGLAMDEITLVLLLEEFGRAACPEPLLEHAAVAIPALAEAGRTELVDAAVAGTSTLTIQLGGSATVPDADAAVIATPTGLGLVEGPLPGTVERSIDPTRRLVAIDASNAVPLTGADSDLAFDRAALGTAALAVGVSQHLLDETVAYVSERHQFGKPVGSYQAVKHHLANVALQLEFARPYMHRAAWCVATSDEDRAREVSAAKALASDAVDLACRLALQCHGAIGYTDEYDLQLWLKRGWALAAAHGDAAWHRNRVADLLNL